MYDSDINNVRTALGTANPVVFSQSTIDNILALATSTNDTKVTFTTAAPDTNGNVTVASGTDVVYVSSSDTTVTTIKAPTNAPVVIFQGKGGVVATINDAAATVPSANQTHVDRVVVGSAGNDKIIVADARNTNIILGSGNSTVQTGAGVDTVQAGLGNSTIVGGSGDYAVVKLAGNGSNYQVTAQNGHAIVTDSTTHVTTDISRIQYVQLDNGNALVFARNSVEGQVASLYHAAFGREADASGLDYWFDLARAGASLKQIANGFASSSEFASSHAAQSDAAFIQTLYQNTFGRAGEAAGVAYWQNALANGATRADLIANFAEIAIQNIQHTAASQEVQVIGHVNIVTGII